MLKELLVKHTSSGKAATPPTSLPKLIVTFWKVHKCLSVDVC